MQLLLPSKSEVGKSMWDFLKFGPAGIAAAVALYSARLVRIELGKPKIRPDAVKLIKNYMTLAIILAILSLLLAGYDDTYLAINTKINSVRQSVGELDQAVDAKALMVNPSETSAMTTLRAICGEVAEIATQVNATAPHCLHDPIINPSHSN